MPVRLEESTKTNYYRHYKDENGFKAEIIMNPRDAMVFAQITQLPNEQSQAIASFREFMDIFKKDYGAKSTLTISSDLLKKLPEDELKSGNGVGRYIAANEMEKAVEVVKNKKHVVAQLEKFDTSEYQFLTKEDLKTKTAELSEFKIKYSSFVDDVKIKMDNILLKQRKIN